MIPSLKELCTRSIVKNKDGLVSVENVPLRLIKDSLKRINIGVGQMTRYERSNPLYVLDREADTEFWLEFLKQDFPTNVHDQYVTSKDSIKEYYTNVLLDFGVDLNDGSQLDEYRVYRILLKRWLVRDATLGKYNVPYRMLYFKYQQDEKRKQEQVVERLRIQVQMAKKERELKSTVAVNESFYINNIKNKTRKGPSSVKLQSQFGVSKPKTVVRRNVERVAFGGMAGRKLDPAKIRAVSRDLPNVVPSIPPVGKKPQNSTIATNTSTIDPPRGRPAPEPIPRSTRKRQDDSQNIFLTTKKPKRPLVLAKKTEHHGAITRHTQDSNVKAGTAGTTTPEELSRNRDTPCRKPPLEAKRKQSQIFGPRTATTSGPTRLEQKPHPVHPSNTPEVPQQATARRVRSLKNYLGERHRPFRGM
ncbi:elongin A KNAG_0F00840 [Huiozyma naganishii CBS 8797]|uniref:Elongin-A n=1 Tax=Huiozyma naganishii (strain ATCC MYA-139 / BCRC 22969 / CBS 8797 / KCTC 17520 / NBRC 10181 / NCYC 3082 / Yp74L-3) TaxID=1071383 RepID=J7RMG9_HUIN7|nr:hypothetical protein KNAG_0F00840 [Kazachstania naganishii CBS 8797]CCK70753.1 hypothetical protein KNAG_0F00840 [Kazachstania naganishii CBS 8797]